MNKEEVILNLEHLTKQKGFIYSLSILYRKDLFFDPEEIADDDWTGRLLFREADFITGLLVKNQIDFDIIPSEDQANLHIENIYKLMRQLHDCHSSELAEVIKQGIEDKNGESINLVENVKKGSRIVEPIFYGDSGAYDFQLLNFAKQRFKKDDKWIKVNKGFTIDQICEISVQLKKVQEKKFNELYTVASFTDICEQSLNIFCFEKEDLPLIDNNLFNNFINEFCITPGEVNKHFNAIGSYNKVCSHPIIKFNDRFLLFNNFSLAQSIYESPFYWMYADPSYSVTASINRGESVESIAKQMLVNVFGNEKVLSRIKVCKGKQILTDIDVLAIAGNKAIIIQAKSKKLTELSRRGDEVAIKKDFKGAIQDAYEQGLISREAIVAKSNKLIDSLGQEVVLHEGIDDAYIICLTTDIYPAVMHQLDLFLKKDEKDPYPLAINLFDLDVLTFYLKNPFEFLYYIRQRVILTNYFSAGSEMSLLAYHLNQKLYPIKDYDFVAIPDSMAQLIDANFPVLRSTQPRSSSYEELFTKWKNDEFSVLIDQIKSSQEIGLTDALFFLFDLAGKGADELIKAIHQLKNRTEQDSGIHNFSMTFDNGKSGITVICSYKFSDQVEEQLYSLAAIKKYKTKANLWLGIGMSITGRNMIESIVFSKEPWIYNDEFEEISSRFKEKSPFKANGKKLGRNEMCYCGSGKKYKKCHGQPQ